MEIIKTQEVVDSARPYLELQSDLLNSIAKGIRKLLRETDIESTGLSGLVRMAAYQAQLHDIELEMAQRN
jgi:hypothetical protein